MSSSQNLRAAKREKNDEFYTLISDIEKEVSRYDLTNKIIYCPCDTVNSNFTRYFLNNYDTLKLCGFICSGLGEGFLKFKNLEIPVTETDFFSEQADIALEISDIVITNPPFSKFRAFVSKLISRNKKFLILGSQNALSYNDIFSLIQNNKIWLGYNYGSFEFVTPSAVKNGYQKDNIWYTELRNICWFTNLPNMVRSNPLLLKEDHLAFQKYDNYDAVEIGKITDIPCDLKGKAGVPITFLNRYCPDQFKIIGKSSDLAGPITVNGKLKKNPGRFYLNGKRLYERIVIEKI